MAGLTRKQVISGALAAGGASLVAASAPAQAPALQARLVSDLDIIGVATRHGRLFAAVRQGRGAQGPQLVEFVGGQPRPYPDAAWNAWKGGEDAAKAFVGVSAVRVGQDHALWVVDSGVPAYGEDRIFGAAKVVRIDLDTNQVTRVYDLTGVTKAQSSPAQIRFNGLFAYVADAGWPGIVILKIETGETRRALTLEPALAADRPVRIGGKALESRHGAMLEIGVSLVEVAPDGDVLYLAPPCGPMARIATRLVDDPRLPTGVLTDALRPFATTPSSFGTAMDADGGLYFSDVDRSRIVKIGPKGKLEVVLADPRLACVAALWIDDDGSLLMPAAELDRAGAFGLPATTTGPFTVWSYPLGVPPLRR
jgi:hypothetical protein